MNSFNNDQNSLFAQSNFISKIHLDSKENALIPDKDNRARTPLRNRIFSSININQCVDVCSFNKNYTQSKNTRNLPNQILKKDVKQNKFNAIFNTIKNETEVEQNLHIIKKPNLRSLNIISEEILTEKGEKKFIKPKISLLKVDKIVESKKDNISLMSNEINHLSLKNEKNEIEQRY